MNSTAIGPSLRHWVSRLGAAFCIAMLGLVAGCPTAGIPSNGIPDDPDNGNATPDDTGEVSGEIISFSVNFGVSALDPPVSVIYSVTGTPDSIAGFYVPVADASPGASEIGNRIIVDTRLPAGTNKFFNFDPAYAGVGFYRVGIIMIVGTEEIVAESQGVVQVQGPPNPFFIQPTESITEVAQGTEVFVSFDAGDPEGEVKWRLFYLSETDSRDNPPAQLGTELAVGSGNVGSATFSTTGFAPGDYELGISATDSGSSVATTRDIKRIVTIPNEITSG
ncbi:MAG: hypothetical protein WBE26_08560, partial [Phycisphaerae bacterium]